MPVLAYHDPTTESEDEPEISTPPKVLPKKGKKKRKFNTYSGSFSQWANTSCIVVGCEAGIIATRSSNMKKHLLKSHPELYTIGITIFCAEIDCETLRSTFPLKIKEDDGSETPAFKNMTKTLHDFAKQRCDCSVDKKSFAFGNNIE